MMNEFDYEELLCSLFGISDEQREEADFDIEDVCFDKFDISFGDFVHVASQLLPLTPVVESPLSKTRYHAFIHNGTAFVKMKAEED
ncbi:hypothetical protein [Candidatus Sodalis sp. SoCistrobi]|uniref:hypothetical protein n=1 Tax=Candidatus Sodalis sp. SoCistrobi TaxID=1922216 RepID=UPI000A04723C|nr:hypothetical protein [Candidatus Sodalis sp. SoCistrobi]